MSKINRRDFGKKMALGLGGITLANSTFAKNLAESFGTQNGERPNVLFICSDQHSFNYAGFAGHQIVRTPNLDQLANEGTVFSNAYSGQPVCVPGRACFMTGMYASDVGSYCNTTVWDGSYPLWGNYFRDAGYYTRASGKMDLDDTLDTGFDEHLTGHSHKYNPDITSLFRHPLNYRVNERPDVNGGTRESYHTDDLAITNDAAEFLNKESRSLDKPWALYLGYQQPHPPFLAKPEYYDLYYPDNVDMPNINDDELENMHLVYQELRHFKRIATPINNERIKKARAAYYGMITEMDELIGKVINKLKETGQYENTIIIYTSDHGESLGEHGLWYKNNLYDCSVRIPLVIKGPGVPNGEVVNTPVAHINLVPTILRHSNIPRPDYLRGEPLLYSDAGYNSGNVVYAESHSEGNCTGSSMIRKGDWKYIYFTNYDDVLFNLADDPGEKKNLADNPEFQKIKTELRDELYNKVDPDKIAADAFRKQKEYLDKLVNEKTEDELFNQFESRLGAGQARTVAQRLKGKY